MTFEDELALVEKGYIPCFSKDGERIIGWAARMPKEGEPTYFSQRIAEAIINQTPLFETLDDSDR